MAPIEHGEEQVAGAGGLKLFVRTWAPASGTRAVIVVQHGFLAHSGLYTWVAEQLAGDGLAVVAPDLRGHGHSDGARYWVDQFADYLADMDQVVTLARSRYPGLPL